jgi:DNA-binding CsgD family transcriptional regulator
VTGAPRQFPTGSRLAGSADDDPDGVLADFAPHLPPALQDIGVGCYVVDETGRVVWLNDAAKAVVGDVTGRLITSVIGPEEAPGAMDAFHRRLSGVDTEDFSIDLIGADGGEVCVEISSVPLREGHRAIGMFGVVTGQPGEDERPAPKFDTRLTRRQREVLRLLGDGESTEQIAAHLFVSRDTARNHVRAILQRLGARSRLEAVAIAHRDGLL